MAAADHTHDLSVGRLMLVLDEVRRYPVKSMLGELLQTAHVSTAGLSGDRRWALLDETTGLVASAKRPARWSVLLSARARALDQDCTVVAVDLPDGSEIRSDAAEAAAQLSAFVGRQVRLIDRSAVEQAVIERTDPALASVLASADRPLDLDPVSTGWLGAGAPEPGFFDYAPIHLIARATLAALSSTLGGEVRVDRFRPNLVLDLDGDAFIENDLVGAYLSIGTELELHVTVPSPRCVVPTLQHGQGRQDPEVLRAIARLNRPVIDGLGPATCLGAYAQVTRPGTVTVGDAVDVRSISRNT